LLSGAVAPASTTPWKDKLDPWVLNSASQGETEFLVFLANQADLSPAASLLTKQEKGRFVYQTLSSIAERTQNSLITELESLGVEFQPYWIANMIWVRAGLNTIQLLASRSDVAHLYANPQVKMAEPAIMASSKAAPLGIEPNLIRVQAPVVWSMGFSGQGVVIGGQDTGYQWDHPALINQYRGWNGISADHNYSWHDSIHAGSGGNSCGYELTVPCDDNGHGTHTMGIMVGDDGGSNQIGMAPGAHWIGCRNMDSGVGKPSTYAECYQWFLAPTRLDGTMPRPDLAPDVVNNSWGCTAAEGCTDPNVLLTVVQNLVAAGIVTTHSAGNSGSNCGSVSEPAAIYAESFTVGATDSTDTIASFSSRGPVTVDGSNRPKPDISAPGVNIRSSIRGGAYANYSGTSMAAPHVAGLVALLISANPAMRGQVDQIEQVIEQSAFHISWLGCGSSDVPNNAYGWGRIDALAALEGLPRLDLEKSASSSLVLSGDLITYTLSVIHSSGYSPITNVVLLDTIPAGSTFVSATLPFTQNGDIIRWDFSILGVNGRQSVKLVVQADSPAFSTITNIEYAVFSDQTQIVRGAPVGTSVGQEFFLPITINSP
jgi:serine protease AprX